MTLQAIYDGLWDDAAPRIRDGQVRIDTRIGDDGDTRRGLTLILRPHGNTLAAFADFLRDAAALEPDQYRYPSTDIHTTVLSIIGCEADFAAADIDARAYASVVASCVGDATSFRVEHRGISTTPDAVLAQGFPIGDGLKRLREHLRTEFARSGLRTTMDVRYHLQTAHSTLIRFTRPLIDGRRFHAFLANNRRRDFGYTEVRRLELIENDWYLTQARSADIASYHLSPPAEVTKD